MPQQHLHHPQVGAMVEQVRRKRMAQRVRRKRFMHAASTA